MMGLAGEPFCAKVTYGNLAERGRNVFAGHFLDFDGGGENFCVPLSGEAALFGLRVLWCSISNHIARHRL
ncbi:hypothetical protein [Mycobacterium asiaticum]|uniref:hypothetical protein n=1 Tax=Mycobacterium asiaticum TaxID=1790 RepID=UPI0012DB6D38|nr:hypothetical protein [Mycobacterium asiaticum]